MQRRALDNTDLYVSGLAFGTGSLHHIFAQAKRCRLLELAFEYGITHFDTSPYYGAGLAEETIGKALKRQRDRITLASKVGLYPAGGPVSGSVGLRVRKLLTKMRVRSDHPISNWSTEVAEDSLNASLRRCRTDYLDLLLLHEPIKSEIDVADFFEWVQRQHRCGKIRYWGVAGASAVVEPWVRANHPAAMVVQTKDSLEGRDADFLSHYGRKLQLTYGYLRARPRAIPAAEIIAKAVERNASGAIIVSTRIARRLAELAQTTS